MKIKTERVLLAQRRKDGKFLVLEENSHTTHFSYTDDPLEAKAVKPYQRRDIDNPQDASHYFENSHRAREDWLVDCVMVPYKITTISSAEEL